MELYATVGDVRFHADPYEAPGITDFTRDGDSAVMPGAKFVPYHDAARELPWRQPPMVGAAPLLPPLTSAPSPQAEPITIVRGSTEEPRGLPPLRATPPVYIRYGSGLGLALQSSHVADLVKNDPIDASVPDGLVPSPGVGASGPPPTGATVPEPTVALLTAGLFTGRLLRRRR
jgi:hypothetical protein